MTPFEAGKAAFHSGQSEKDNPYIIGTTKLGATKLAEGGAEWLAGWQSARPARVAGKAEMAAAAKVDISRFRRKANRYYER